MNFRKKEIKLRDAAGLRNYGLYKLGQQEMSRHALMKKMELWAQDKADIEPILDSFEEAGYINDQRFAEMYVRSCRDGRRYGPIKIRLKLKEKGIAASLIAEVLNERDEQWYELARRARESKFGDAPEDREAKAKQTRFLMTRGFNYDHASGAFTKSEPDMYE